MNINWNPQQVPQMPKIRYDSTIIVITATIISTTSIIIIIIIIITTVNLIILMIIITTILTWPGWAEALESTRAPAPRQSRGTSGCLVAPVMLGFPSHGVPLYRWMVYFMENPNLKWGIALF